MEGLFLELSTMKSSILLLALLLSLGCTGIPLYRSELQSMADKGLGAALAEVNSAYAVSNLFRASRATVKKVLPMGRNTTDMLMMFDIKETECAKATRKDPQTCAFRPGFFVSSYPCAARVRVSGVSTHLVSLRCGLVGSSSSESSEEVFSRGRPSLNVPIVDMGPAPSVPPVQSGRSLYSQIEDIRPRGDTFNNFLV
ncbi:unnamed protein product [Menidia menidia]|uniref:Secreted phosphoprotein 24 n=1 Tax=Menidia menidia TaxID=238744 RepID=A0A8S4BBX7_9TELE|nr:unnamed protein product [Menidia menidia]